MIFRKSRTYSSITRRNSFVDECFSSASLSAGEFSLLGAISGRSHRAERGCLSYIKAAPLRGWLPACRLWVICRHGRAPEGGPLYPQKRTMGARAIDGLDGADGLVSDFALRGTLGVGV
jgi:hypothetical protein